MLPSRAKQLDMLAFGGIRGAAAAVSFFGAFWLLGVGRAEDYGRYLAWFAVVAVIATVMRVGADHTLLKLARGASPREIRGSGIRARIFATWLRAWVILFGPLLAAAMAGIPYAQTLVLSALMALGFVAGCHLRSLGILRPAPLFDPPIIHLFGVGLLCLGKDPETSLLTGVVAWIGMLANVFVIAIGRLRARALLRRHPLFLASPRRLFGVLVTYVLDIGSGPGINVAVDSAFGPAALATFNALLKTNFIAEQAVIFQRVFRLGDLRDRPDVHPREDRPSPSRLAAIRRRLEGVGSGTQGETAIFLALSAAMNLVVLGVLLDHDFGSLGAWGFLASLLGLQSVGLLSGPAPFQLWLRGEIALVNALRALTLTGFFALLLALPPKPELWVLSWVCCLSLQRVLCLWALDRRTRHAGTNIIAPSGDDGST